MTSVHLPIAVLCLIGSAGILGGGFRQAASSDNTKQGQSTAAAGQDSSADARMTRGKKLVLMNGTFQLVRSYERKGDRVRYLSAERGDWEEIPAALVDWDATAKAEKEEEKTDAALVSKVHAQEEATKTELVLDVDASLQVAPGTFLPPGEGMFAVEGRSVIPIPQVGTAVRTDKKQTLKRIFSPIPIVSSKQNVELPGAKAVLRINSQNPEFYLRELQPDYDQDSALERTRRQSVNGPDVELFRATTKGNKRILESIKSMYGGEVSQERNTVSIQEWEVAKTVYRFTLSEPLLPGEYALAEVLPDGMNMFVWDFGVDGREEEKKKD